MAGGHEEIDPIKSNPNSHKAIGVVAMTFLLVGLAWWLKGSPFTMCRTMKGSCPTQNTAACQATMDCPETAKCPSAGSPESGTTPDVPATED